MWLCGFVATEYSPEAEALLPIVESGNHSNFLAASVVFESPLIAYRISACRLFTFATKYFDKELLGLCSKPGAQMFLRRSANAILNDPPKEQCYYFEIVLRMAFTHDSFPAKPVSRLNIVEVATIHAQSALSDREV